MWPGLVFEVIPQYLLLSLMTHYMGTLRCAYAYAYAYCDLHENIIWFYSVVHTVCAKELPHHCASEAPKRIINDTWLPYRL